MRIAVSIWENKVSPVLDMATKLLIVEQGVQKEESHFEVYLIKQEISQRCSFIRALEIDVLICGAVSRQFSRMLKASGINIISGISGPVKDVLKAYFHGNLLQPKFLMPGCKSNNSLLSPPVGKESD
jgi:predicted Fe-Mo cluster-binding NifX family protein